MFDISWQVTMCLVVWKRRANNANGSLTLYVPSRHVFIIAFSSKPHFRKEENHGKSQQKGRPIPGSLPVWNAPLTLWPPQTWKVKWIEMAGPIWLIPFNKGPVSLKAELPESFRYGTVDVSARLIGFIASNLPQRNIWTIGQGWGQYPDSYCLDRL